MKQINTGGPAFPSGHQRGMNLRQYAAITLRVPDSGTDWLDDMIREARRMDYAGQALRRHTGWHGDTVDDMAQRSFAISDAMLAAREASE